MSSSSVQLALIVSTLFLLFCFFFLSESSRWRSVRNKIYIELKRLLLILVFKRPLCPRLKATLAIS